MAKYNEESIKLLIKETAKEKNVALSEFAVALKKSTEICKDIMNISNDDFDEQSKFEMITNICTQFKISDLAWFENLPKIESLPNTHIGLDDVKDSFDKLYETGAFKLFTSQLLNRIFNKKTLILYNNEYKSISSILISETYKVEFLQVIVPDYMNDFIEYYEWKLYNVMEKQKYAEWLLKKIDTQLSTYDYDSLNKDLLAFFMCTEFSTTEIKFVASSKANDIYDSNTKNYHFSHPRLSSNEKLIKRYYQLKLFAAETTNFDLKESITFDDFVKAFDTIGDTENGVTEARINGIVIFDIKKDKKYFKDFYELWFEGNITITDIINSQKQSSQSSDNSAQKIFSSIPELTTFLSSLSVKFKNFRYYYISNQDKFNIEIERKTLIIKSDYFSLDEINEGTNIFFNVTSSTQGILQTFSSNNLVNTITECIAYIDKYAGEVGEEFLIENHRSLRELKELIDINIRTKELKEYKKRGKYKQYDDFKSFLLSLSNQDLSKTLSKYSDRIFEESKTIWKDLSYDLVDKLPHPSTTKGKIVNMDFKLKPQLKLTNNLRDETTIKLLYAFKNKFMDFSQESQLKTSTFYIHANKFGFDSSDGHKGIHIQNRYLDILNDYGAYDISDIENPKRLPNQKPIDFQKFYSSLKYNNDIAPIYDIKTFLAFLTVLKKDFGSDKIIRIKNNDNSYYFTLDVILPVVEVAQSLIGNNTLFMKTFKSTYNNTFVHIFNGSENTDIYSFGDENFTYCTGLSGSDSSKYPTYDLMENWITI